MPKIIIGSTALKYFNLNRLEPKDIDYFITSDEKIEKSTDSHIIPDNLFYKIKTIDGYATPNMIYTIKLSHFCYDIHWNKTKLDILWLKSNGCEIDLELFYEFKEYWKLIHGNKDFLSLNKTKSDFFTDNVEYKYDHDYLHELVAYPNKPIYTKCLKDNEDIMIDKSKFDLLSFEEQIQMFREEITVIACERWLVNSNKISWFKAYLYSLRKTILTLTKNWANEFIIFNLEHFIHPDYKLFKHLLKTLKLENDMSNVVDLTIFEEILDKLNNKISLDDLIYELCNDDIFELLIKILKSEYNYDLLDYETSGEGQGEYCYGVFKLKDKIYKAEYRYYSYRGHEYGDISHTLRYVKPVEKLVTFYEEV